MISEKVFGEILKSINKDSTNIKEFKQKEKESFNKISQEAEDFKKNTRMSYEKFHKPFEEID